MRETKTIVFDNQPLELADRHPNRLAGWYQPTTADTAEAPPPEAQVEGYDTVAENGVHTVIRLMREQTEPAEPSETP